MMKKKREWGRKGIRSSPLPYARMRARGREEKREERPRRCASPCNGFSIVRERDRDREITGESERESGHERERERERERAIRRGKIEREEEKEERERNPPHDGNFCRGREREWCAMTENSGERERTSER